MSASERYYCTHFDINYVGHSISLYNSLLANEKKFILYMFCMDDLSFNYLTKLNLSNARLISYLDLENEITRLNIAKSNRTRVEYFYTCSPAICYYLLTKNDQIDIITYLDSDIYFFSSPDPIFEEISRYSIGIIEHRFHWLTRRNVKYGIYNVGWISFRNDSVGLECLVNWLDDCIEWCYQRLEGSKYADQKYLDYWPSKYNSNLCVIKNKSANLAIWNIANYKITSNGNDVFIDGEKLIFYHFASLKQISANTFTSDLSRVFVKSTKLIVELIYMPYIKSILKYQYKKIEQKDDIKQKFIFSKIKYLTRFIRKKVLPDVIIVK